MKKLTIALLVVISTVLTTINLYSVQRVALFEEFTNTACGPCASVNPSIETFLANNHDDILSVWYHVNWPSSSDPFYVANIPANMARRNYYTFNAVPYSKIDGVQTPSPGNMGSMTSALNTRLAIPSPVELSATVFESTNSYDITIDINTVDAVPSGTYKLHTVVLEDNIEYNAPNGETHFDHVMREMYPSGSGLAIDLVQGNTITEDMNLSLDPSWVTDNLEVVLFIQNDATKEVIQAARANFDFIVANPVETQMMVFNETLDLDISDVFSCVSGSYEVSLEDGYSSNTDIATASINGTTLNIETHSTSGLVDITLTSTSHDDHIITNTFSIIVNNPQGPHAVLVNSSNRATLWTE